MVTLKNQSKTIAVLVIALVIGAYFIASRMQNNQNANDWMGISVHSLSANEARLVNESGARWIRVDCYAEFEIAVVNAKAYDLKVLGILGSWMFNK